MKRKRLDDTAPIAQNAPLPHIFSHSEVIHSSGLSGATTVKSSNNVPNHAMYHNQKESYHRAHVAQYPVDSQSNSHFPFQRRQKIDNERIEESPTKIGSASFFTLHSTRRGSLENTSLANGEVDTSERSESDVFAMNGKTKSAFRPVTSTTKGSLQRCTICEKTFVPTRIDSHLLCSYSACDDCCQRMNHRHQQQSSKLPCDTVLHDGAELVLPSPTHKESLSDYMQRMMNIPPIDQQLQHRRMSTSSPATQSQSPLQSVESISRGSSPLRAGASVSSPKTQFSTKPTNAYTSFPSFPSLHTFDVCKPPSAAETPSSSESQLPLYDTIEHQQQVIHNLMQQVSNLTKEANRMQHKLAENEYNQNPFTKHFASPSVAVCMWELQKRGRRILKACNPAFINMLEYKGTVGSLLDHAADKDISYLFWYKNPRDRDQTSDEERTKMLQLSVFVGEVHELAIKKLKSCKRKLPIRDKIYYNSIVLQDHLWFESYQEVESNLYDDQMIFNGVAYEKTMEHVGIPDIDVLQRVLRRAKRIIENSSEESDEQSRKE